MHIDKALGSILAPSTILRLIMWLTAFLGTPTSIKGTFRTTIQGEETHLKAPIIFHERTSLTYTIGLEAEIKTKRKSQ